MKAATFGRFLENKTEENPQVKLEPGRGTGRGTRKSLEEAIPDVFGRLSRTQFRISIWGSQMFGICLQKSPEESQKNPGRPPEEKVVQLTPRVDLAGLGWG